MSKPETVRVDSAHITLDVLQAVADNIDIKLGSPVALIECDYRMRRHLIHIITGLEIDPNDRSTLLAGDIRIRAIREYPHHPMLTMVMVTEDGQRAYVEFPLPQFTTEEAR